MPESAGEKPGIEAPESQLDSERTSDLAELRSLLVGPEQNELRSLRSRLDDPKAYARDVSNILPDAIALRSHDAALSKVLAPTIEQSLNSSVRRNPRPLADALFPVMGPAIRKSVSHALSAMLDSFNKALEQSLSWRSIRWRIEAWRSGKPFSEIVLLNTLLYRVEQVFLIQKSSGLLLQHVTATSAAVQDADMVSGMLTAIRDFVHDSFGAREQDSLEELQVGDLSVWTEQGPQAILAAVVRGKAPRDFRVGLQDALESIHLQYAEELESFAGDVRVFESAQPILEACLQAQYRQKGARASFRAAWAFAAILLLLLGVWGFFSIRGRVRWSRYLDRIRSEPGIVVLSAERKGGKYVVRGLRDPLAPDPASLIAGSGLSADDVDGQWDLYQALDPRMVLRRAIQILDPPGSVKLTYENGVLAATGLAPHQWILDSRKLARLVPGTARFQDQNLEDADLKELKDKVEATNILFIKRTTQFAEGQRATLAGLSDCVVRLTGLALSDGFSVRLRVTGHADSDGTPEGNKLLSASRANVTAALLREGGLNSIDIATYGAGSTQPLTLNRTEEEKEKNRRASFQVELIRRP